jgi:glutathione S-transferase
VLELYHSINSVCAQKVRIALKEKGQEAKDHIMTLRGDQYEPAYLELNPNGVVPTLIHDGEPITESRSKAARTWLARTFPMRTAP